MSGVTGCSGTPMPLKVVLSLSLVWRFLGTISVSYILVAMVTQLP